MKGEIDKTLLIVGWNIFLAGASFDAPLMAI